MKKRTTILLSLCSVSAFLFTGCHSPNIDETNNETQITTMEETETVHEPNTEKKETLSDEALEETEPIKETIPAETQLISEPASEPDSEAATTSTSITLEDAKNLALEKAGGQGDIVTAVDSYYEGIPVYKIIILSENMKYISHIGKDDSQFYGYKEINIHSR